MSKIEWTNEKLDELAGMYLDGTPTKEIGEYFGIKANSVCYWVNKLGLPKRGKGKFKKIENPFEKESHDRDYWLGYIFADGHVHSGWMQLCSIEREVVDEFNKFCKNQCTITSEDYEVSDGSIHTIYKANLYSKKLTEWFMKKFNISSTKHHNLNPSIKLNWDIIRGYFDGDGSSHKKGGLTISSSSKIWIDRLTDFIHTTLNIEPKINQYDKCYKLCIWKKEDLRKIVPCLYYNANFYLKYKKDNFEPFISNDDSKQGELLEACNGNQQPSQPLTKLEGSETNS